MLKWVFGKGKRKNKSEPAPPYEEAKKIAASGSASDRARLAAASQLQPEFLYYFASDKDPDVRREVAKNPDTPLQADILLARDPDTTVKMNLGDKIGTLLPNLSEEQNRKVTEMVFEVVEILSQDSLPSVRAMISDQIKSLDTVPPRIVQRLAKDTEAIVSTPVLEFSAQLTEQDLMAIIASGTRGAALAAIARRDGLSETVGTEIANTEDVLGVDALLRNATAKLPEDTLTAIVEAAEDKPAWHDALVGRKGLTKGLMRRMAGYVSESALNKLINNNILVDDALAGELRASVKARVAEEGGDSDEELIEHERKRAEELREAGRLQGEIKKIGKKADQKGFLVQGLALLANVDDTTIRKLIAADDPKLYVALAWHCGLGMGFAEEIQKSIGKFDDKRMLKAEGGAYPLSEDDMAWALEVVGIS